MGDDPKNADPARGGPPRAFSDVVAGSSTTAPPAAANASPPRSASAQRDFEQQRTMRMYVVEKGDNLSRIARKFYGDPNAWKRIYEENRDVIRNPDLIEPGWKIRIPD